MEIKKGLTYHNLLESLPFFTPTSVTSLFPCLPFPPVIVVTQIVCALIKKALRNSHVWIRKCGCRCPFRGTLLCLYSRRLSMSGCWVWFAETKSLFFNLLSKCAENRVTHGWIVWVKRKKISLKAFFFPILNLSFCTCQCTLRKQRFFDFILCTYVKESVFICCSVNQTWWFFCCSGSLNYHPLQMSDLK